MTAQYLDAITPNEPRVPTDAEYQANFRYDWETRSLNVQRYHRVVQGANASSIHFTRITMRVYDAFCPSMEVQHLDALTPDEPRVPTDAEDNANFRYDWKAHSLSTCSANTELYKAPMLLRFTLFA